MFRWFVIFILTKTNEQTNLKTAKNKTKINEKGAGKKLEAGVHLIIVKIAL